MKLIKFKFPKQIPEPVMLAVLAKLNRVISSLVPIELFRAATESNFRDGSIIDNLFDALDELHMEVTQARIANIVALGLLYIELKGVNADIALNAEFNRLLTLLSEGHKIKGVHPLSSGVAHVMNFLIEEDDAALK